MQDKNELRALTGRKRLLERLEKAWSDFRSCYEGLSEADLLRPGVSGAWSVRDVIAHVTWWEEQALEHLPAILEGRTPPRYSVAYGGIDAFNAIMTERTKGLSLAEVFERQHHTHSRLLRFLEQVPEEHLAREGRFRRRLRLDTYGHYAKHARAIRAWRERIPERAR